MAEIEIQRTGPGVVPVPDRTVLDVIGTLLARVQTEGLPGKSDERWQEVETELAVMAEELRAQQEEIDEALGRLRLQQRLLVDGLRGVAVAMFHLDPNGLIRDANPAAHRLLALPSIGMLGKPLLAYVAPADRTGVRSALRVSAGDPVTTVPAVLVPRNGTGQRCVLALTRRPRDVADDRPDDLLCLVLPLDVTAADPVAIERRAAALGRLCGVSLGLGDLGVALTQVVQLLLEAVPDTAAARVDWMADGTAGSTAAEGETWGSAWRHALESARASGQAVRAVDGGQTVVCLPLANGADPETLAVLSCRGGVEVATDATGEALAPYVVSAAALLVDATLIRQGEVARVQLETALSSRAEIDQAKGMIMMTVGCSADEAFQHLVGLSSRQNRKLREVAHGLVEDMVKQAATRRPGH